MLQSKYAYFTIVYGKKAIQFACAARCYALSYYGMNCVISCISENVTEYHSFSLFFDDLFPSVTGPCETLQ